MRPSPPSAVHPPLRPYGGRTSLVTELVQCLIVLGPSEGVARWILGFSSLSPPVTFSSLSYKVCLLVGGTAVTPPSNTDHVPRRSVPFHRTLVPHGPRVGRTGTVPRGYGSTRSPSPSVVVRVRRDPPYPDSLNHHGGRPTTNPGSLGATRPVQPHDTTRHDRIRTPRTGGPDDQGSLLESRRFCPWRVPSSTGRRGGVRRTRDLRGAGYPRGDPTSHREGTCRPP